jgi:cytochrome c-type biogenesis protein CcmH/NrfG
VSDADYGTLWDAAIKKLDGGINLDGRPLLEPGLFEKRRLKQAAELFEKAAAAGPTHAGPPLFLGKIAERLGDTEGAVNWLRRAYRMVPDELMIVLEYGAALGRSGRHTESASVMEAAARAHPDDPRIHVNYGISLLLAGQAEQAVQAMRHVVTIEPDRAANHQLLRLAVAVAGGSVPVPRNLQELQARL